MTFKRGNKYWRISGKPRLEYGGSQCNKIINEYKRHAKERGVPFYLSREEFKGLTQKTCFYCGAPPSNIATDKRGKNYGEFIYGGIDRLDNNKGYELSNCVPCCRRCNRAKDTMSFGEFLSWISTVYMRHLKP